jgi:hypothetical protein
MLRMAKRQSRAGFYFSVMLLLILAGAALVGVVQLLNMLPD